MAREERLTAYGRSERCQARGADIEKWISGHTSAGLLLTGLLTLIVAVVDALLMWADISQMVVILLWLAWQVATLGVLVWSVPSLFRQVRSVTLKVIASVTLCAVVQLVATVLGVTLIANMRLLLGLPL